MGVLEWGVKKWECIFFYPLEMADVARAVVIEKNS
jgi:hypothetical protein